MVEKVIVKIDQAKERATRLQRLSDAVNEAERKRDACLYNLFADLHDIEVDVRKLGWADKRKILCDRLNFRTSSKISGLVIERTCPDLDAKKRAKYAAVLRFVAAAKPPHEKVKDFVRKNGGINGCIAKEKHLRERGRRRKASKR
jgi:hypothetical protein